MDLWLVWLVAWIPTAVLAVAIWRLRRQTERQTERQVRDITRQWLEGLDLCARYGHDEMVGTTGRGRVQTLYCRRSGCDWTAIRK